MRDHADASRVALRARVFAHWLVRGVFAGCLLFVTSVFISPCAWLAHGWPSRSLGGASVLVRVLDRVVRVADRARSPRGIECLGKALVHPDMRTRQAALARLVQLGSLALPAHGGLVHALGDSSVSPGVERLLSEFGNPACVEIRGRLASGEPSARAAAVRVLTNLSPPLCDVLPDLLRLRVDPDSSVREAVAMGLGKVGASNSVATSALMTMIRDRKGDVSRAALISLGTVCPSSDECLDVLEAALSSDQWIVRAGAVTALELLLRKSSPAVVQRALEQDLLPRLDDEVPAVRCSASRTLGVLGRVARDAVNRLARVAVSDVSPGVQRCAVWALGEIGGCAASATLRTLSEDSQGETTQFAREAMSKLGECEGTPAPAAP